MTTSALSGPTVDGDLYNWVTTRAQHAPALVDDAVTAWTGYGLLFLAVLVPLAWWTARSGDAARMARALAAPAIVVLAYAVDLALKDLVRERRPCRAFPTARTLQACPAAHDFSFPSNHAAVAAAVAVTVWAVHRGLGAVAAVAALAMAASRVWVGAHYPHDVVAGLAVGAVTAAVATRAAGAAAPGVERLRRTRWRPLAGTPRA